MKVVISVLALIFITGCMGRLTVEGCKERVAGLCINSEHEILLDEINYAVQVIEEEARVSYPEMEDFSTVLDENFVTVDFTDKALAQKCEEIGYDVYACEQNIGGVNFNGKDIVLEWHKCLAFTSFGHELLHSVEMLMLDIWDEEHIESGFYYESATTIEDKSKVAENLVKGRLFQDLESCLEFR